MIPGTVVQSGSLKMLLQMPRFIATDFTLLYKYVFLGCNSPGAIPAMVKRVPEIESRSSELVIPAVTAAIEERITFFRLWTVF